VTNECNGLRKQLGTNGWNHRRNLILCCGSKSCQDVVFKKRPNSSKPLEFSFVTNSTKSSAPSANSISTSETVEPKGETDGKTQNVEEEISSRSTASGISEDKLGTGTMVEDTTASVSFGNLQTFTQTQTSSSQFVGNSATTSVISSTTSSPNINSDTLPGTPTTSSSQQATQATNGVTTSTAASQSSTPTNQMASLSSTITASSTSSTLISTGVTISSTSATSTTQSTSTITTSTTTTAKPTTSTTAAPRVNEIISIKIY
jgi:hypothetical protein